MSTIKKLDPNVREAQRRRKAVCEELKRAPDSTGRLQRLGTIMDKFRRVPHLTGAQKDDTFKVVLGDAKTAGVL